MRNTIINLIFEKARKDKNVILLVGDLGYSCIEQFAAELPAQFFNAGIAEQGMAGIAAGLAKRGKEVYVYSIGNFPSLRCLEQIRNDCAYHELNVTFISNGAGFEYGALGMSHHATEDMAIMRALPGVSVFSPADKNEAAIIFNNLPVFKGVKYLRINKAKDEIGIMPVNVVLPRDPILYIAGCKSLLCSAGTIVFEALAARNELLKSGIDIGIATFPCIKPMQIKAVLSLFSKYDLIISLEEHNLIGGLGSALAEIIADNRSEIKIVRMGINDEYIAEAGKQSYLRKVYRLNAESVAQKVLENV